MNFADRVRDTTFTPGVGPVSLNSLPPLGARTFAAAFAVGTANIPYVIQDQVGPNWEIGYGTLSATSVLTRNTVTSSSNGGLPVAFGSNMKDVVVDVSADALNSGLGGGGTQPLAFSATIPFTGDFDMGTKLVTAPIAFVPNMVGAIRNGTVALSVKANGTDAVTFAGFVQDNTSDGWNNHAGLVHRLVFFNDGLTTLPSVSITQVPNPPAAPTIGTATLIGSTVSQAFTPPANDNGATVTGYIVTAAPSGVQASGPSSPIVLTGLPVGAATTQTVQAVNLKGPGVASAPSNSVTIPSSTVPGAPTGVAAVGGAQEGTVSWVAPASNGGSAITGYTVTPQTVAGQSPPSSVTPVTVGNVLKAVIPNRQYFEHQQFVVAAINAIGTGAASSPSSDLQLQKYPTQYFGTVSGVTPSTGTDGGQTVYIYTGTAAGAYSAQSYTTGNEWSQSQLAANANGAIIATHNAMAAGRGSLVFWSNNGGQTEAAALLSVGIDGTNFVARVGGTQVASATGAASGHKTQLRRRLADGATTATTTITAEYSIDGGNTWTVLYTLTNQPFGILYSGVAVKDIGAIFTVAGH